MNVSQLLHAQTPLATFSPLLYRFFYMMKADLGWLQGLAGESAFVFRAGLKERLLAHLVCSLRLTSLGEYAHPTAFPLKFTEEESFGVYILRESCRG